MKKHVGQVSEDEKREIQGLFERKNGLIELAKILNDSNPVLYEKMVKDMGETATMFQQWWNNMGEKYSWESHPSGHWEIDFQTNNIFLII